MLFRSVHVRDVGLERASDDEILQYAIAYDYVVITRDGDFSRMLANTALALPSVVHLRLPNLHRPVEQAQLLVECIMTHGDALARGAIVSVDERGARVRLLPI